MLVDDSEIDNLIHEKIIESTDFAENILIFDDGQEALDYLKSHQDTEDELPEIVFLDINMPEMDGFEFLEDFEKFSETVKNKCKIIMLSSSISPKDIDRAASSRYVKKYLNKPLKPRYLDAITV